MNKIDALLDRAAVGNLWYSDQDTTVLHFNLTSHVSVRVKKLGEVNGADRATCKRIVSIDLA